MVAAPIMDFGIMEERAVTKFLFLQDNGAAEIHGEMKQVLKDGYPSFFSCQCFGLIILKSQMNSGQDDHLLQTQRTKPTLCAQFSVHGFWISVQLIAETLEIPHEIVGPIIRVLDMRKRSANWVLKCLKADQKRIRVTASKAIFDQYEVTEALLVIWDET